MKPPVSRQRPGATTPVDAEGLAADILAFLGADMDRLGRFLAATGLDVAALRRAATEPAFTESLLDYLCGDERLLVAFAAETHRDPASVELMRRSLAPPPFEG